MFRQFSGGCISCWEECAGVVMGEVKIFFSTEEGLLEKVRRWLALW